MPITLTRPRSEDIRFRSDATGEHILDAYLEAAEIGGKTLTELLTAVFDTSGDFDIANIQFRIDGVARQLQSRVGIYTDPEAGWQSLMNASMLHDRGTWSGGTSYQQTDLVTHDHDLWICSTANSDASFSQAKWSRLIDWAELDALRTQVRDDTTSVTSMKVSVEASKVASEAARDKSQLWSEEQEDTPVEAGQFSAKHHAAKAAGSETMCELYATAVSDSGDTVLKISTNLIKTQTLIAKVNSLY